MDYAIEINNLSKRFERFHLNNVNLALPKGSIMGFIGENGAGKTTTIKLMLNLLKADLGSIRILGLDLKRHEDEAFDRGRPFPSSETADP